MLPGSFFLPYSNITRSGAVSNVKVLPASAEQYKLLTDHIEKMAAE